MLKLLTTNKFFYFFNIMASNLAEIIENAPRCKDEFLVDSFLDFFDYVKPELVKRKTKYGLKHFRDAFLYTNLNGIAMHNIVVPMAFVVNYLEDNQIPAAEVKQIKRSISRIAASYIENPSDINLKRVGDFMTGLYKIVQNLPEGLSLRRSAETYKSAMFF